MKFTGEYRIPAPKGAVWRALNDVGILKASIRQVEELEWTGERDLKTTIRARVGPMKARFRGTIELADIDAPHAYTLIGQGDGGVAGFAKATARVRLEEAPEASHETVFIYDCEADIGGRLMTIGGSLVRGVADRAAESFFEAFADRLVVAIAARDASQAPGGTDESSSGPAAAPVEVDPFSGKTFRADAAVVEAPFSWSGAASRLSEQLKALEDDQQLAGLATAGHWDDPAPPPRDGQIPVNAALLLIVGGWVAMAAILLLLFAL
ncbi:CoxG family protein [Caenispirillum salinarum]|uniref:CoxG family protein n=1 Tax=Caenispirillum salinarum TaxID=859058 RepID=UPI00384D40B6